MGIFRDFWIFASLQLVSGCVFAKRFQNCVAHEVAAYVWKTGADLTWNNCFPLRVDKAMAFDCNPKLCHI
jgi:hypothetical protein